MLEFDRVCVAHRGKPILHEVSFSLRPHRITVLLGRNGSGKSFSATPGRFVWTM